MDKVTFTEAATAAGVHFNTLRNWRKANKLTTAEKVFENGVEIWVVDLTEVAQLARQSKHKRVDNNKSSVDGLTDDLPPIDVSGITNNAPLTIRPDLDNFMVLVERSQKPLLERIDRLQDRVSALDHENGELKERLRALEAAQAVSQPQSAPEPSPVLSSETLRPEPPKKRRWWQF